MKTMLLAALLFGAASPASAQQAIAVASSGGHSKFNLTVPFGQEVRLNKLRLRPVKVLEDSRCPRMVNCVWRGRLKIELAVRSGAPIILADDAPVRIAGGTLRLKGATPISNRGETFPPKAYRFQIEYER